MAILHSCCLWKSLRKGSYASAVYTLLYFSCSCIIMSISLHGQRRYLHGKLDRPSGESFLEKDAISSTTVIFNILLLFCTTFGILSSLLVVFGLRTNKREFFMPWILVMCTDLTIEICHFAFLLARQTLDFEPLTAILFTVDFFIVLLNIYCLLCVISQYQEYKAGRGLGNSATKRSDSSCSARCLPTKTLKNTFRQRQSKVVTSPLMCPHTITIIPEETQLNGCKGGVVNPLSKQRFSSILSTKNIQFPTKEESVVRDVSCKEKTHDSNSNGHVDTLTEHSESVRSWHEVAPQKISQEQA